nr:tape_meas_nterm: tape measure domain protein [uncultured bacterium]AMP54378.1 tape_meas_nterm: tape measure domain protein [uncultured bacterium]AMP54417.1 tape_meas_nterm: tape measure domain protein [uncultured bacterium]AMP54464.1 tape_meas_nterm: tape measure domain protein [uncultured bacterium]
MALADTAYVDIIPRFDDFTRELNSAMSQMSDAIASATEDAFSGLSSAAETAAADISTAADDVAAYWGDANGDIIDGFGTIIDESSATATGMSGAFDTAFSAIGSAASAVGETVATAAGIAGTALAGLTASAVSSGIEFNAMSQEVFASLSTLLGTGDAARDLMDDIIELNQTAAFSRSSFLEATQTLVAYGVEADDVGMRLEQLQDAAVGVGAGEEGFERLVDILADVSTAGRIGGDELNRLGALGINATEVLAESLGATTDEVEALIQAGDIGAAELADALGTTYAGAVEGFGDTIQGAQGAVAAGLRNIGSALVEPFIGLEDGGAAVEGLNAISAGLAHIQNEVLPPLMPLVESIADAFVSAAEFAGGALQQIDSEGVSNLLNSLEGMGPVIAAVGAGLAAAFAGSLPVIGGLVGGLNPLVLAFGALAASSPEIRDALGDAFTEILEAVQPLVPLVTQLVNDLVAALLPAIASLIPVISDLVLAFLPFVESIIEALLPILPTLIEALLPLTDIFLLLVEAVTPLLELFLGIATEVLEILIPVFLQLATDIIDFVLPTFEMMSEVIGTVVDFVVGAWMTASGILDGIWNGITNAVTSVTDEIRGAWDGIVSFVTELPGRIASAASGMWDWIVDGFRGAINGLVDGWNSINIEIGPFSIPDWVPIVGGGTFHIPDMWPNLPRLNVGGMSMGTGAAILHPNEAVLPLEDDRTTMMMSDALSRAIDLGGMSSNANNSRDSNGNVDVKVYIDGREFRGMIRSEISSENRRIRREVSTGPRDAVGATASGWRI